MAPARFEPGGGNGIDPRQFMIVTLFPVTALTLCGHPDDMMCVFDQWRAEALKPLIEGMHRAAAMGYRAEDFQPNAASFEAACRAASAKPTSTGAEPKSS